MTLSAGTSIENYVCDSCRTSKVACSRESHGCKRCRRMSTNCAYSRSGVIRRNRKRKNKSSPGGQTNAEASTSQLSTGGNTVDGQVLCHLATDIQATREQLTRTDTIELRDSLDALASLEACSSTGIQVGASKLDMGAQGFYSFEEYALEWAEVFESFVRKSAPLISPPPPSVMDHLRAARPSRVHDRAWLVIYYSVILNAKTSISESLKQKLKHSLYLALSDVRVLLEPSDTNINALVLVLTHMSELAGPSLCWMLATSACRMLQALGVNNHLLDRQTRERRRIKFWHLNLLDKGLAVTFGRTPTFDRQMVREICLPTMEQVQPFTSHVTSTGASRVFGAHFTHQKILLSLLMGDIWQCLYGEEKANDGSIKQARKDLVIWYEQAQRILEAAALSEKPFCDAKNARSIDVALRTLEFHFLHLSILLTRSSAPLREQCIDSCKRMLHLLQDMSPESQEPYHPMIWQLVCCPFTPLLILFRDILSNRECKLEEKLEALAAMDELPGYLNNVSARNGLAARLEGIAKVFVRQAKSIISRPNSARPNADISATEGSQTSGEAWTYCPASGIDASYLNSCHSNTVPIISNAIQPESESFEMDLDGDLGFFTSSFNDDGIFDWLSWSSQGQE